MKNVIPKYWTLLFIIPLLILSCNNDDDSHGIQPVEEEIDPPNGVITLTNLDTQLKISFTDGSFLEETAINSETSTNLHDSYQYIFELNTLKKVDESGTALWTKSYPMEAGKSFRLNENPIVFFETTAFISYYILDTTSYASEYFLEAINLDGANTIWSLNVGAKTVPYVYQNRLLTLQYPSGNVPIIFQYRNKSVGDVLVENTFTEIIGGFIFDGDLIVATSWSDRVFAMDRSLTTIWSFDTEAENPRNGYIFENQYIFHSWDKHIYSIAMNSGELNWKTALPEKNILGLHIQENYTYVGQQTDAKLMTLSKINSENGEIENSTSFSMSEDYYTTKLVFYEDYLLLITSPNSDERENLIQLRLIYLPESVELWSANHNIPINLLKTNIVPEE